MNGLEGAGSDIFMKPSALILKYGWIKHFFGSPEEGFCMLGALRYSCKTQPEYDRKLDRLCLGIRGEWVGTWNDAPGRTKRQVLAALRKAGQ